MASDDAFAYACRMVFLDPAKRLGSTDTLGADSLPSLMRPRKMKEEERLEKARLLKVETDKKMRLADPLSAKKNI